MVSRSVCIANQTFRRTKVVSGIQNFLACLSVTCVQVDEAALYRAMRGWFLDAFYGLRAWDDYADPAYFDKLLLTQDKKPSRLVLTRIIKRYTPVRNRGRARLLRPALEFGEHGGEASSFLWPWAPLAVLRKRFFQRKSVETKFGGLPLARKPAVV
jgi:hypothetical protein